MYILAINPLSVISFANIFSLSVGCLFVFLVVSLAVIKIFFFKFNEGPFVCFYSQLLYSSRWNRKDIAVTYVKGCSA